jgi:excisionase family DNA binding protein
VPERLFFNLDEAAQLVGLTPPTLRRAIRQGQLAYAKPGRAYLVKITDVNAWLESQQRQGGRLLGRGKKI